MAGEGENLGVATIYLTVDKTSMDATIGKAKLQLAGMGAEAQKQYEAMSASQQKMAQGLVKQAELINRTTAERVAYNAQLKIGGALGDEIAARALANAQKTAAAQQAAAAATTATADKFAVSAAERAAQEERFAAVMAAERAKAVEAEAARAAAAQARAATVSEADAAELAAFNTTVRAKQALILQLDAAMASGLTTQREIAAAEDALDAAMAGRALTQKEQLTYITALDAAEQRLTRMRLASAETINVETASLEANTAAIKLNSRTQYEIGVLGGEIASGNISRVKRSIPALLNASGLTTKLMSPAGLGVLGSVATVGALTASYVQAAKEADELTRAIYATGQQGIITADQMESLALKVGDSTGSYGDAAKALDALVSSGKYASDQYELLTRLLVNFQNITGGSLQEGLQAVDSLNGRVGDGLVKLNSQYHFLTDTVYEQILALQAQGQTEQARDLERKAFADGINQSADEIKAHLDPLAKAWDAVGNAASSAWHKMGQGIRANVNDAIAGIENYFTDLGDLLDRIKHPVATAMNGGLSPREVARSQATSNAASNAQKESLSNQATQTLAEFGAEAEKYKSAAEKRAAEIISVVNRTNAAVAKALAAGNKKLADEIRASGAALEVAIATHGAPKAKRSKKDPGVSALAELQSQIASLTDKSLFVDGDAALTKYVQGVAKLNDEFDAAISKHDDLTKAQAAYDDGMKALNADLDKSRAAQAAEAQAMQRASDAKIAAYKAQIALQVESIGLGDKEIQRAQQLAQIHTQYADQIQKLEEKAARHPDQKAAIDIQIANARREMDAMVQATKEGFGEMDAAESNWANGAIAAMQNWADQGANIAGQVKGLFTDAFSNMNDALVNFVQTGKLNFKQLIDSFIADLVRMELRIIESRILQSILGSVLGSGAGVDTYGDGQFNSLTGYGTYTGAGSTSLGIYGHAKGGVFGASSLSRFLNGVYDSPQFFVTKHAKGNVFAEAGPEAVMPLSYGPDGKLGVKAQGSGGGDVYLNVEVKGGDGNAKVSQQHTQDNSGNKFIKLIIDQAVGEVDKRIARNGSTGQMIQHAFGLGRRGVPVAG